MESKLYRQGHWSCFLLLVDKLRTGKPKKTSTRRNNNNASLRWLHQFRVLQESYWKINLHQPWVIRGELVTEPSAVSAWRCQWSDHVPPPPPPLLAARTLDMAGQHWMEKNVARRNRSKTTLPRSYVWSRPLLHHAANGPMLLRLAADAHVTQHILHPLIQFSN